MRRSVVICYRLSELYFPFSIFLLFFDIVGIKWPLPVVTPTNVYTFHWLRFAPFGSTHTDFRVVIILYSQEK
jgi:hypothetical protein